MKKSPNKIYQRNNKVSANQLRIMRYLFLILTVVATMGAVVIIVSGIIKLAGKIDVKNPFANQTSANSIPIYQTSETTVKEEVIPELLPENALADSYWGKLEEVTTHTKKTYKHNVVKGLFVGAGSNIDECLELCDKSELNALVIDLKTASEVCYGSDNETVKYIGYSYELYDMEEIVKKCHEHNVLVIGRIVSFNDFRAAEKMPERAIKDSQGRVLHYKGEGDKAFLDPYNKDNWEYLIELAEEAVSKYDLDEIQFDYIRFPVGATQEGTKAYFGDESQIPSRAEAINRFIQTARIRIQDTLGVPVSADIFAIVLTSPVDAKNLGQQFETIGFTGVDSVCPMIYPSHYAEGTIINGITFEHPDKEPYMLCYQVFQKCKPIYTSENYSAVRPYFQAFTAAYLGEGKHLEYDYNAINAQIRAAKESGIEEFILWSPKYSYPDGDYSGNIASDSE